LQHCGHGVKVCQRNQAEIALNIKSLLGSAALVLAACGGGGGSPGTCSASPQTCAAIAGGSSGGGPVTGSPAGLFHGTTGTGRTASALVLEGGDFWVLYGPVGSSNLIDGAQQGHASFSNGTFTSADVRDFSLETGAVGSGSATGTYVPKSSIAATVDFGAAPVTLSASYDPGYDLQATLAMIAGSYSGTAVVVGGFDNATMTILPTGAITGTSQPGCSFSGNIVPHAGVNSYAVNLTFAGGTCANEFSTLTGIAYRDAATNRVYSATVNPARTNGFIFAGGKL
jgi:hypothetical protein